MGEEISASEETLDETSTSYLNEIARIKRSDQSSDVKLELLDLLIKDFMRKKYHIKKNSEYSELIDFFLDKKRPHIATFCHEMVEEMYGGEELTEGRIQLILDDAKAMFKKDSSFKEKEKLDISLKTVLNPFSSMKRPEKSLIDTEHISKQTKKQIEKFLGPEDSKPIREEEEQPVALDLEAQEEIDSLKNKLNLSNKGPADDSALMDNPEKIQNIDDLERIKDKIRLKKMDSYQKKQ